MKPGRGPHVRIGVLASFTPSLGTRLSSSLSGGGDGVSLGVAQESRPLAPPPHPSISDTGFLYRCSWASPTVSCRGFRGSPEPMGQAMLWQRRAYARGARFSGPEPLPALPWAPSISRSMPKMVPCSSVTSKRQERCRGAASGEEGESQGCEHQA